MKYLKLFEDIDFNDEDWEEKEEPKKNSRYKIIYADSL